MADGQAVGRGSGSTSLCTDALPEFSGSAALYSTALQGVAVLHSPLARARQAGGFYAGQWRGREECLNMSTRHVEAIRLRYRAGGGEAPMPGRWRGRGLLGAQVGHVLRWRSFEKLLKSLLRPVGHGS